MSYGCDQIDRLWWANTWGGLLAGQKSSFHKATLAKLAHGFAPAGKEWKQPCGQYCYWKQKCSQAAWKGPWTLFFVALVMYRFVWFPYMYANSSRVSDHTILHLVPLQHQAWHWGTVFQTPSDLYAYVHETDKWTTMYYVLWNEWMNARWRVAL